MNHQLLIGDLKKPVVILDVDQGNFIDCNDHALSFFRLSREEMLIKNPYELSPANVYGYEAEAYSRQVIQEALAGANPVFDWIHIDKDGSEIPCEVRLIRFPPYNRQLIRGTIIDKREASEKESFLRESEERLRLALEATNIGTFDFYPKEERVFWNEELHKIFDVDPNDKVDLNSHFFSIIHPDDQDRVVEKFERSLEQNGKDLQQIEYRIIVNGKTKHILAHGRLIRNKNGEVIRMLGTSQDISDLRESEERIMETRKALEESERRYRNVFNQQFQFTALLDLEGRVVHINELPLKIQGTKREDYLGQYFWKSPGWCGNKEWEKKIKSQVLFTKKTGEQINVEDPYYGPNSEIRYTSASYTVIKDANGEIENILVQAIDITTEKLSNKEIEKRENQLSLIYNSSTDFMLLMQVKKEDFIIESLNNATLTGLSNVGINVEKEKVEGMNMAQYFEKILHYTTEQQQVHFDVYRRVKKTKESVRYTTKSNYNGHFFAIETTATPIVESGRVKYILTVSHDISEITQSKLQLEHAVEELRLLKEQIEQENIYLKEEIKQANDFENMVFKSKEFRGVLNKVEQVAKTDATVLIRGETGTGKELIARAIHNVSRRSEKPMIKVNAAAIPRDLIESELFGYVKGAFTGATGEKPGKFELADGGSIFLDEIGDMSMDLQVKILRVLQEGEVVRLGSNTTKKIDTRIITATNKNLEEAVKMGKFREDLYFRLNVFPIKIPPLRSRPDDVPILTEHFIAKYNVKHSKRVKKNPKGVMDYLKNYTWPGNIRELENTVERAVILTSGETFDLHEVVDSTTSQDQWEHENSLDVIMKNHIQQVLKDCQWKIEGESGAAVQLKIKPSTLRDKMKKFKINRPN